MLVITPRCDLHLLRAFQLFESEHTLRPGILRQVQTVLPVQSWRDESSTQVVIPALKVRRGLLGSGERDKQVGLDPVRRSALHVPT